MSKSGGDDRTKRVFTRRALLLTGGQTLIAAGLGARMYQLQVLESEKYQGLAEDNRINLRLIAPIRGQIYDRNGEPLAVNRQNYRVVIIPERTDDAEETLHRLAQLIDLPEHKLQKTLKEVRTTTAFVPVAVAENLSWEEFARVNANAPALPGIAPDLGWTRSYPHNELTGHVVGYVGAYSDSDKDRRDAQSAVLKLPGMKIGKNGVERVVEERLRGKAGSRNVEVNHVGREIRDLNRQEGEAGADIGLSLDLKLQDYAMKRLEGESGAVVVMDIWNGDVLALASSPGFDPNAFVLGISQRDYDALNYNERRPLYNKAVQGAYPPGSTFKMLVALAGLQTGAISPGHRVTCAGKKRLGNRDFHCWKRGGHGVMSLHDAIKHSCDIFFYDVAQSVGIDRLADLATRFGIGERVGIELPNVSSGVMPTKAWKFSRFGEAWQKGETWNAGIGQGFVTATPLQLAVMTARIANGGYGVNPRLIRSMNGEDAPSESLRSLGVDERHIEAVKRAMFAVTNEQGGTAYRSRITAPGYELAGKTGTSQVRRITAAERASRVRKNEELPWKLRDHALFVAFAPYDEPRYAISVVVEHGGSGSAAAAPVARDVMLRTLFHGEPPKYALPEQAELSITDPLRRRRG